MNVLIVLLLLYCAYLITYMVWEKQQCKKQQEGTNSPVTEKLISEKGIIGKSLYKMESKTQQATTGQAQAATKPKDEKMDDIPITFDEKKEGKSFARVPDDKLDDVFTDVRMEDVEVEYEEKENDEELREEQAHGYSFDEIGDAVDVTDGKKNFEAERHKAGAIFTEMEGNSIFDRLVESSPLRAKKIRELMDSYLKTSTEVNVKEAVHSPKAFKIPEDIENFDIRDYV